jgi:hypothetical protein
MQFLMTGIKKVHIHIRIQYIHMVKSGIGDWTRNNFRDEYGDELKDKHIFQAYAAALEGMDVKWVKFSPLAYCVPKD